MSTTLRVQTLRLLRKIGVKQFLSISPINERFICHVGDSNGENPYYNRSPLSYLDILLMAAWCRQFTRPLILDVGGNVGFVATQIAQLAREHSPRVFSFEPVPFTFQRLVTSVRLLGLQGSVYPVCAALSNRPMLCRVNYSEWDTMFAQVAEGELNSSINEQTVWCSAVTLDHVAAVIGEPVLVKIDVEGHEVKVLEGARMLIESAEPPAICLESNPTTLHECNAGVADLVRLLTGFDLYYINDFDGQRLAFGEPIRDLRTIEWVCNVFAVPRTVLGKQKWLAAVAETKAMTQTVMHPSRATRPATGFEAAPT